jgi:hypothetical protein
MNAHLIETDIACVVKLHPTQQLEVNGICWLDGEDSSYTSPKCFLMLIVKVQYYCVHSSVPLMLVLSYIPQPSHAPFWWHKLQWNLRVIVPFCSPSGALLDGTRLGGWQQCSAVCATGSSSFRHKMYSITWTWCFVFIQTISYVKPIPVALCSKASVCIHSRSEIVDSNPAKGISVCLLWVLCVVRYKSLLQWVDHSSRGILPTVVPRVWSGNLKTVASIGLQCYVRERKKGVKLGSWC